jgi:GNAT superfamily N-acetyltransferase
MLTISKVLQFTNLESSALRERAERGHCPRSKEFLASKDGAEAGLLSYEEWNNNEPGFIYEIFVLPSFRRQGIGKSLLSYAESFALHLGCKSVRLKPHSLDQEFDQSRLIAWYAREGYRQLPGDQEQIAFICRARRLEYARPMAEADKPC